MFKGAICNVKDLRYRYRLSHNKSCNLLSFKWETRFNNSNSGWDWVVSP